MVGATQMAFVVKILHRVVIVKRAPPNGGVRREVLSFSVLP